MPDARPAWVSPRKKTVTLDDGQRLPITNFLRGREEIEGPEGADACVAGPDADGMWHACTIKAEDYDEHD